MKYAIVCFDFDSTLSAVEGIDELATAADKFTEISQLTNAAMNGEIALQEVYGKRLEIIKPNKAQIHWLGELYCAKMVADADSVCRQLLAHGCQVHIVSGGIREAILPLAARLGIDACRVHAVDIFFDNNGDYSGFDASSPLVKNGGKGKICQQINPNQQTMAMVGDGNTDLEAGKVGATTIGFGGVVSREIVKRDADIFVASDFAAVLPHLLN